MVCKRNGLAICFVAVTCLLLALSVADVASAANNNKLNNLYVSVSYCENGAEMPVGAVAWYKLSDKEYALFMPGGTDWAETRVWFDGIEVKDLTIRWNADKAGAWQPDCVQDNGYLVFNASLSAGDRYSITVAYPNDAFAFSVDRQSVSTTNGGGGSSYTEGDD